MNWELIILKAIEQAPAIFMAIGTFVAVAIIPALTYMEARNARKEARLAAQKADEAKEQARLAADTADKTHKAVNGETEKMKELIKEAATSAAILQEKKEQATREGEAAVAKAAVATKPVETTPPD